MTTAAGFQDPYENIRRLAKQITAQNEALLAPYREHIRKMHDPAFDSLIKANREQAERMKKLATEIVGPRQQFLEHAAGMQKLRDQIQRTALAGLPDVSGLASIGRGIEVARLQGALTDPWLVERADRIRELAEEFSHLPDVEDQLEANTADVDLQIPPEAAEVGTPDQWQNWYRRGALYAVIYTHLNEMLDSIDAVTRPSVAAFATAIVIMMEALIGGPPPPLKATMSRGMVGDDS